jgi:spermidine synthase
MTLLNFFIPETIKFPDSPYNKNIILTRYFNTSLLLVDGLIESGDILTQIWTAGIKQLIPKSFRPQSVLLLGLAGGSNAKLVSRYYPRAKITAVEIDPFMVEIGEKYFGLGKIKNLEIVVADALDYVNEFKKDTHFDLVLVDCFEGQYIPEKLEDLDFHQKLRDHSRFTLINRLWWFQYKDSTLRFLRSLSTRFFFVKTHTRSNLIISLV